MGKIETIFNAQQLKEKFLKEHLIGDVGVIAILPSGVWFHVETDEKIPENCLVALHPKNWEKVLKEQEIEAE